MVNRIRGPWAGITFSCCLIVTAGCSMTSNGPEVTSRLSGGLQLRAIDQQTKAEACRLTAVELAAAAKDDHAIVQFEQARKLDPQLRGIAHPLAVLYDRQGRIDAAQNEYERALQEAPRDADVLNDYGYFLYSRGDNARARQHIEQAIARNPDHPKARINLAMVLAAEGRYDESYGHFEQALGPAAAHHNIGLLQLRNGLREQGLAHLRQASEGDPSLGSANILASLMPARADEPEILPAGFSD